MKIKYTVTFILLVIFIAGAAFVNNSMRENETNSPEAKKLPSSNFLFGDGIFAKMETGKGTIWLRLFYKRTPKTVLNFIQLSQPNWKHPDTGKINPNPLYQNLKFHRVIPNFMVQGGDPEGTGRGGPGYRFNDEFHPDLRHTKPGILSMANAGPNTNGSQFFITHKDTPWLDFKHSVFGEVVGDGQTIVNAVKQGDTLAKISIIREGKEAEAFDEKKADEYAAINRPKWEEFKKSKNIR